MEFLDELNRGIQEQKGQPLKDPLLERSKHDWVGDLKEMAWVIDSLTAEQLSADIVYSVIGVYLRGRGIKRGQRVNQVSRHTMLMADIILQLLTLCQSDRSVTGTYVTWDNVLKSIKLAFLRYGISTQGGRNDAP